MNTLSIRDLDVTLGDLAVLEGDDREVPALEAADDLADEASLDSIGLADDEGAIHAPQAR